MKIPRLESLGVGPVVRERGGRPRLGPWVCRCLQTENERTLGGVVLPSDDVARVPTQVFDRRDERDRDAFAVTMNRHDPFGVERRLFVAGKRGMRLGMAPHHPARFTAAYSEVLCYVGERHVFDAVESVGHGVGVARVVEHVLSRQHMSGREDDRVTYDPPKD